jgi:hypothetical protein
VDSLSTSYLSPSPYEVDGSDNYLLENANDPSSRPSLAHNKVIDQLPHIENVMTYLPPPMPQGYFQRFLFIWR